MFRNKLEHPFYAKPNDGKDDHAAIQAAIRLSAERGTGLYLPPGRYQISSQLRVDRDGVRLRGAINLTLRRYDLQYIQTWSLLLDLRIIALTVVTILKDKNAY